MQQYVPPAVKPSPSANHARPQPPDRLAPLGQRTLPLKIISTEDSHIASLCHGSRVQGTAGSVAWGIANGQGGRGWKGVEGRVTNATQVVAE
jgi:hypothetical protein